MSQPIATRTNPKKKWALMKPKSVTFAAESCLLGVFNDEILFSEYFDF